MVNNGTFALGNGLTAGGSRPVACAKLTRWEQTNPSSGIGYDMSQNIFEQVSPLVGTFMVNLLLESLNSNVISLQNQNDYDQLFIKANTSRYKTELCRPFEENGECKYGEKCQFAHGARELRRIVRHPKYKTVLCRTYHSRGFCPYGARCHFIHNVEECRIKSIKSRSRSLSLFPGLDSMKNCSFPSYSGSLASASSDPTFSMYSEATPQRSPSVSMGTYQPPGLLTSPTGVGMGINNRMDQNGPGTNGPLILSDNNV